MGSERWNGDIDDNTDEQRREEEDIPPLSFNRNNDESYDEEDDESLLEILIQSLTGTTFHVKVSPWETGDGLKNLLHETQGIPAIHQHLLLGDKELLDDETLIDQGVRDKSVLKLILALKGGPVNSRRIPPHEDNVWREFSDYFESNKDDLWDESPGRQVTVLVIHEGDAVNLYKVVENEDGVLSPLEDSFSSDRSGQPNVSSKTSRETKEEENNKIQNRIDQLRKQMENVKLKKKARKNKASKPTSPTFPVPLSSRRPKLNRPSISPIGIKNSDIASYRRIPTSRKSSISGQSSDNQLTSRSIKTRDGSRPPSYTGTTMESNILNLSKGSTVLEEISRSIPPKHVDFSRHPRLESIRSVRDRGSLGPLKENSAVSPLPELNKTYESYRQSLVRHGKAMYSNVPQSKERPTANDSGRRGPVPLYNKPHESKRKKNSVKLNKTLNEPSLKILHELEDRPKTSPEVLERRPDTASTSTTISEIIQLRGPDEKLKEIIDILNSSRSNTPSTQRSETYVNQLLNQNQRKISNSRHQSRGSFSVSVTSLRPLKSPNSIRSTSPLLVSEPKVRRKNQQEVLRSHTTHRSSGKTKVPKPRDPSNNVNHPKKKKRSQPRCAECRKKLSVGMSFTCRCGLNFCSQHRYAEAHECSYDYKSHGKKLIELSNPLVEPSKLPKI